MLGLVFQSLTSKCSQIWCTSKPILFFVGVTRSGLDLVLQVIPTFPLTLLDPTWQQQPHNGSQMIAHAVKTNTTICVISWKRKKYKYIYLSCQQGKNGTHPTQPKKLRSMRMCCKFSRTSTSPPHPTPPNPRSYVACGCVASSHERQHPHPTQPKKLRSMRMCCKFSRTSTSPPHPTQEVT